QATADTARSPNSDSQLDFEVFDGVIPLITFGTQRHASAYSFDFPVIGSWVSGIPPVTHIEYGSRAVGPRSGAMSPTFIGVNSSGNVIVHLQTDDLGNASQTIFAASVYSVDVSRPIPVQITYVDQSYTQDCAPEWFGNNDGTYVGFPRATLDAWHHLLLSWDIGSSESAWGTFAGGQRFEDLYKFLTTDATMYCAVDGVDQSGPYLPSSWLPGIDPNSTMCRNVASTAGAWMSLGPPNPPGQTG